MSKRNDDDEILEQIPRLRRYARALTGDADRADDLVQDCLTRGLSRLRLWRRGSDLRAWLFTIMHNLYANEQRRLRRTPTIVPITEAVEPPGKDMPLDDSLQLVELQAALGRLPPEQREVLLLVALEGMRYEDVARILRIPAGTVMSRLHRARERLRRALNDESKPGLRSVK